MGAALENGKVRLSTLIKMTCVQIKRGVLVGDVVCAALWKVRWRDFVAGSLRPGEVRPGLKPE